MGFLSFSFFIVFVFSFLGRIWFGRTKVEKPYLLLLLAASLVFYASFIPQYLPLLLVTGVVDYYLGHKIFEHRRTASGKSYLVLSIACNLGLLAFFKYSHFFLGSLQGACAWWGLPSSWVPNLDLVLPIGISFFTFQSMSYTIDIYRGELEPIGSYWRYLLFVSFFTHLVSGPIVRAKEWIYQFDRKRKLRWKVFLQGVYLVVMGVFLKRVVADNLAAYVDQYWRRGAAPQMPAAVPWVLALMFYCQIFADFFGYTNIAMGTAYMLGFKLPANFNSPYIATSFREFWTRWHMTLSRWIRDYLYIPLGGNRGSKLRRLWNLMTTFVLAGLWHGAATTFILWGALHGAALAVERFLGFHKDETLRSRPLRFLWFLVVQGVVLVGWVFFRAEDATQACEFLRNMVNSHLGFGFLGQIAPVYVFLLPVLVMHLRTFFVERGWMRAPGVAEKGALCALMLYCVFTLYGKNCAFIYFQF